MRNVAVVLCFVAVVSGLTISCGNNSDAKPETHPELTSTSLPSIPARTVDFATGGTIHGVIRFHGRAPRMASIDFSSNPQCERQHLKSAVKTETVVVNANATLRNTLVWLKSGVPNARWQTSGSPVTLDQNGCIYEPHVVALLVNQELEIRNSDPVNHDVHGEASINSAFNVAEPPRAESLHRRFDREEVWFPVTCSIHPWMRAYVAVISHPFFAITGTNGEFTIKGIPAGSYVVEAVHEQYGRKQMKVNLEPHAIATANFAYPQ